MPRRGRRVVRLGVRVLEVEFRPPRAARAGDDPPDSLRNLAEEARRNAEGARAVTASLARAGQRQPLHRARHADVEEAALLLDAALVARRRPRAGRCPPPGRPGTRSGTRDPSRSAPSSARPRSARRSHRRRRRPAPPDRGRARRPALCPHRACAPEVSAPAASSRRFSSRASASGVLLGLEVHAGSRCPARTSAIALGERRVRQVRASPSCSISEVDRARRADRPAHPRRARRRPLEQRHAVALGELRDRASTVVLPMPRAGTLMIRRSDDVVGGFTSTRRYASTSLTSGALVEAHAADDRVRACRYRSQRLFEHARLGVGAVEDRESPRRAPLRERHRDALRRRTALRRARRGPKKRIGSPPPALGPELLVLRVAVVRDHGDGACEDRLRRAVVALERDDLGRGEVVLEVEDVADLGAAPAVDRLVVVADDAEVAALAGAARAAGGTARGWCPGTRRRARTRKRRSVALAHLGVRVEELAAERQQDQVAEVTRWPRRAGAS